MLYRSALDAIIIADSGVNTLSGTNPLKLHVDGRVGDIQTIRNFLHNNGRIVPPIEGDDRNSWSSAPKLNGIHLASYLAGKGYSVELIHNYAAEKQRFASLMGSNPKSIIISTSFIFFKHTLRTLVEDIRKTAPDVPIIAGGTFVNYSRLLLNRSNEADYETDLPADDFLFLRTDNEPAVDLYIVSPRGEETLNRALERISTGLPLEGLENTARLSGNSYVFGPEIDDISGVGPHQINWDALPDSFFSSGVIPVQASNGCPYNCAFCNFTKDRRIDFVKPLDLLVRELKSVQKRGIRYVWFVDDNFRLGRGDLDTVSRRFIDEDIQVKWMCFIRAGTLLNADLELLRQAGCIEVQIGLESGDPAMLGNMNKKADPAMYEEVIGNVLRHGINVSCYFITGFPGETEETAATTRNFLRRIEHPEAQGILTWSIYPFLLSPLSPVYEPAMREKFGLSGYLKDWRHATMDYSGAKKLALKAFLELEHSGQIYRGDNLDMISELPPEKRKEFHVTRHLLAKKSLQKKPVDDELLLSMGRLFPPSQSS